jgi:ABC-type transporter Mla maintaining outer membrane lipid asymmetry ATPase subunit MlaF
MLRWTSKRAAAQGATGHQLSGGMAQRASLARALVKADSILLSLWASAAPLMVYG